MNTEKMHVGFFFDLRLSVFICGCFLVTTLMAVSGCQQRASPSEEEPPDTSSYRPEQTPATQFERDMQFVRSGHFAHVWVFARKDGAKFTPQDGSFLRTVPNIVDWVKTDEGRKYIAGSNFDIEPAQMAALQKRFKVEDYSGK